MRERLRMGARRRAGPVRPAARSPGPARGAALILLAALAAPSGRARAGELRAGVGRADITPPAGTPSAGYGARLGRPMKGVHDPLEARALAIQAGRRALVLAGVDSVGFLHEMVAEIRRRTRGIPGLERAEIHVGSSHTHSGGGAIVSIPEFAILFGPFDPARREQAIAGTVEAIRRAAASLRPARIGIGYGRVPDACRYRGDWPPGIEPSGHLTLLKAVAPDGTPIAALFAFGAHPTVLGAENLLFSADWVGCARRGLERRIGEGVVSVFFNGAEGDVSPRPPAGEDAWARCEAMGERVAAEAFRVWKATPAADRLRIESRTRAMALVPRPSSAGFTLPVERYETELGAFVLDGGHAFLTVPGELGTVIEADLRRFARWLGFRDLTILGLTDDASGYIVIPESWYHRTYESTMSFFGPRHGERMERAARDLLHLLEPEGAYHGSRAPLPAGAAGGRSDAAGPRPLH